MRRELVRIWRDHRPTFTRPAARVLLWLNLVAATCAYGMAALFTYYYTIGHTDYLPWALQIIGYGGLLTVVYFAGDWLDRH